jgi:cell division protein FtsW (lipid II flippase)
VSKAAPLPKNRAVAKAEPPAPAKPALTQPISELLHSSPDGPVDSVLAAVIIALIGFGVVMVYSASAIEATTRFHDAQFFLKKSGASTRFSRSSRCGSSSRIDYRASSRSRTRSSSVAGCSCSPSSGSATSAGNADRWLNGRPGPHPAGGAREARDRDVARLLALEEGRAHQELSRRLPAAPVGVSACFMLLCLKQPDFGSAVVLLFLTFTLLFVAGARVPYIAAFTVARAGAVGHRRFSDYRYARYLAWVDMEGNRNGLAYQPFQSVMSFGSGGFSRGLGLGRGLQVLYLPEAHTDFISRSSARSSASSGSGALRGVPDGRRARREDRARGGRRLRQLPRLRHLDAVRRAGADQPLRRDGDPADQGPHAAVRQLRRLVAARERRRHRRALWHLAPAAQEGAAPSAKKLEVAPPAPKQPAPSASAVVLTKADEGEVGW